LPFTFLLLLIETMLRLEIVTPERKVVEAEVDSVTVPTASGEAGIMSAHAPLISALKPGVLSYSLKGNVEKLAVSTGFVEISNDLVSVLSDFAESAEEIDVSAAKSARDEAEKELSAASAAPADETEYIRERIDHANARLSVAATR
jgi:F-type H+-transporting ATPase subunit epsilon